MLIVLSIDTNNIATGFPRYSRGLRSWKIFKREYQNCNLKLYLNRLKYAKNDSSPFLFEVFKPVNSQNREYQTLE